MKLGRSVEDRYPYELFFFFNDHDEFRHKFILNLWRKKNFLLERIRKVRLKLFLVKFIEF